MCGLASVSSESGLFAVCLWTFTNCSNSTWTDLQGIDIGGCCGGNESEQNGTVCGRQRGRMGKSFVRMAAVCIVVLATSFSLRGDICLYMQLTQTTGRSGLVLAECLQTGRDNASLVVTVLEIPLERNKDNCAAVCSVFLGSILCLHNLIN